jgi:hypothetical protein
VHDNLLRADEDDGQSNVAVQLAGSPLDQTRSLGDVGSMSGLPENGHGDFGLPILATSKEEQTNC